MLQAHGEKVVPVVEEERLLADTEQAGDEGEEGQPVLVPCAHVQGLAVQHLNQVLEAGHVHLVLDRGCHRDQDLDKQSGHRVLYVLVAHLEEVGRALLHKLKAVLKLLDGHHLHAEELHSHQQGDDGLSGLGRGFFAAQLAQFTRESLAHGLKPRRGENAQHLGIEVGNGVDGGGVGAERLAGAAVAKMLEAQVLNVMHKVLVARMDVQLFEDLDEDEAENELHGQVTTLWKIEGEK